MTEEIRIRIIAALKHNYSEYNLEDIGIEINRTSDKSHGDFYTNIAMKLAKILKKNPINIAKEISENITIDENIIKIESVAPGYINFFISTKNKYEQIKAILKSDDLIHQVENVKKIHVEYVSANPTGPLHIGHGRGMILGEVTAKFLSYQGHEIKREYYVNDAGRQIDLLLTSVLLSHIGKNKHIFVDEKSNEDGHLLTYRGSYINDVALSLSHYLKKIDEGSVHSLLDKPIDSLISFLKNHEYYFEIRNALVNIIIDNYIEKDLAAVGISFDSWYKESQLYETGLLDKVFIDIENKNLSYSKDGALWFKNTLFGDDQDRVLVKKNGDMTYFATDIAYHVHKFKHHDVLIDIWGADHHDYAKRLTTALKALDYDVDNRLQIHLVQFANLYKSGKSISMSTRSGEFYPIQELVDDIGRDATKFFYLVKKKNSILNSMLTRQEKKTKIIQYITFNMHMLE